MMTPMRVELDSVDVCVAMVKVTGAEMTAPIDKGKATPVLSDADRHLAANRSVAARERSEANFGRSLC